MESFQSAQAIQNQWGKVIVKLVVLLMKKEFNLPISIMVILISEAVKKKDTIQIDFQPRV